MRQPTVVAAALMVVLSAMTVSAKEKEAPYAWPALPDAAARQSAADLKSEGGLVILERRTLVDVASFGEGIPGVRTDSFIRFLVANQGGIRSASIPVHLGDSFALEKIEGRSIAPDGKVTVLDEKKDVERTDVKRFGDKETLGTQATVHFPAPQVGSVLDLHYVSFNDSTPYFYSDTLLYDETTTVKGEMEVKIRGGIPGYKWSILTFGDTEGAVKLEALEGRGFVARMGTYEVETREKNAPPSTHTSPIFLCYIDLSNIKTKVEASKVATSSVTVDSRGRVQGFSFPPGDPTTLWWIEYLKNDRKLNRDFIKRSSRAEDISVDAAAPATLPLEERLTKLYRLAQTSVRLEPYAERVATINDMMNHGSNGTWQGTLFYAYLLDRAKIEYHLGLVTDREALRFSPVIRNGYVYSFATAVIVPRPGQKPLVLMPGDFSLDFGALPFDRQDALVFWLEGEDGVRSFYTAPNDPGADTAQLRYSLEMDGSGNAKGAVTLSESGAESHGFRRWYVLREIGAKSPERDKKQDKTEAERKQQLDEELEKWFWYPGDKFTFSGYELVKCLQDSATPLEIKAQAQGKGIGQANGDRWLVLANPLVAGYTDPFVRPLRRFAIWNGSGGKRILEGELLLPAGAKVVELAKGQELHGPEGLVARYEVVAIERDGRVLLKSKMEYDIPLILGSHLYGAYRLYLDGIAKMGQDHCIIQLSAEKELE